MLELHRLVLPRPNAIHKEALKLNHIPLTRMYTVPTNSF
jgi:hypothetical protein